MNQLLEKIVSCPYCGESLEVLIDPIDVGQQYIEDCQVCCKPINFLVTESLEGDLSVSVYSDDEAF